MVRVSHTQNYALNLNKLVHLEQTLNRVHGNIDHVSLQKNCNLKLSWKLLEPGGGGGG